MRVPELKTKQKNQNPMFRFVSHFTGLYCKEKKNIQQLLLWTFHIPTYKWITNTVQGSTLFYCYFKHMPLAFPDTSVLKSCVLYLRI